MVHELKILPVYFNAVKDRSKTFEVRKNDRDFRVNDYILLREIDHFDDFEGTFYTGREIMIKITYILKDPEYCKEGYVIIGFHIMGEGGRI